MKKPIRITLLTATVAGAILLSTTASAFWWPFSNGWNGPWSGGPWNNGPYAGYPYYYNQPWNGGYPYYGGAYPYYGGGGPYYYGNNSPYYNGYQYYGAPYQGAVYPYYGHYPAYPYPPRAQAPAPVPDKKPTTKK